VVKQTNCFVGDRFATKVANIINKNPRTITTKIHMFAKNGKVKINLLHIKLQQKSPTIFIEVTND
jgi:hypothetical protein